MLKAIRGGMLALLLLAVTIPVAAAPAPQKSDCKWLMSDTLNYYKNPYADKPMAMNVLYIPPWINNNGGDRDFSGHGPAYTVVVKTFVASEGMGAIIYMRARETKPDWTTAEGTSQVLWFLRLNKGWKLAGIGEFDTGYRQTYGSSLFRIEREWSSAGTFNNYYKGIKNYDPIVVSMKYYGGNGDILKTVRIIGDTRGKDVGDPSEEAARADKNTHVLATTWVTQYLVCPN